MVANILGEEDGRASSNVADNKRNSGTEDDMVIIGCTLFRRTSWRKEGLSPQIRGKGGRSKDIACRCKIQEKIAED